MSSWQMNAANALVIGMLLLNSAAAQSQPTVPQSGDQSGLLSTVYIPPNNFGFREVYDLLRQHNALEKTKEILSPFQFQLLVVAALAFWPEMWSHFLNRVHKPRPSN
jgi:hypothetical protein